tara:strand:- start:123 stop:791 length:669 start_codon:yes stop_codon:yes gene_type:complete
MKIVFAGCSFTWGFELENPEEQRFSRLVCNKLEAEEINVSHPGYSNDLLLHKFLKYCTSTEGGNPDIAVIQWTQISRWQMWDDSQDDWETLNINKKYKLQWNAVRYYRHVYTEHCGIENYWKNVYLAEQYCKDNNIKLIMMDMNYKKPTVDYVSPYQSLCEIGKSPSKMPSIQRGIVPYSKSMTPAERQEYWMELKHPSPKGHQLIADYVEEQIQLLDNLPG